MILKGILLVFEECCRVFEKKWGMKSVRPPPTPFMKKNHKKLTNNGFPKGHQTKATTVSLTWIFCKTIILQRWLSENQSLEAQKGLQNSQKVVFDQQNKTNLGQNWIFPLLGMQNWLTPIIWALWVHWGPGSTRQPWLFWLRSLIFTHPRLQAQPLRKASKHSWEIGMEWGSNLSLFFYQE